MKLLGPWWVLLKDIDTGGDEVKCGEVGDSILQSSL
jgi:hypothetical protein